MWFFWAVLKLKFWVWWESFPSMLRQLSAWEKAHMLQTRGLVDEDQFFAIVGEDPVPLHKIIMVSIQANLDNFYKSIRQIQVALHKFKQAWEERSDTWK